jgi:hypothetical protein
VSQDEEAAQLRHPDQAKLERLLRGELPREEAPAVIRHLLTGCPQCLSVTRRAWACGEQPLALRILLEEGLASQAEASRTLPFRLRNRREEA